MKEGWLAPPLETGYSPASATAVFVMTTLIAYQSVPASGGSAAPAPSPSGEAPGAAGAFGAMWPMILGIAALFIVTSWQSRSQKKKLAGEIAALKKGDRVRLQSGFIAKLVELGAQISVVELGSNLRVEVLTSAIVGRDDSDTTPPAAKK